MNSESDHYIYQPGSTVSTNLIKAEGIMKHTGVISLTRNSNIVYFEKHELRKSHRAILYEQIDLNKVEKEDKRY